MCNLREETGWAFPCWHPPSGCGRDGATISLTGNCNTFPIQLIFTVCLSLFYFQNLYSTLRASPISAEQGWGIFLVISPFLPQFFYVLFLPVNPPECSWPWLSSQLSHSGLDAGQCSKWWLGTWWVMRAVETTNISETHRLLPVIYRYRGGRGKLFCSWSFIHPICKSNQGTW